MSEQRIRTYEDECRALDQSIIATGCNRKEIAGLLYPGSKIETAETTVSRLLDSSNVKNNLTVKQAKAIMRRTRPEDFIYHLCDEFGFERPQRKKGAVEAEIRLTLQSMQKQMQTVMQKLERMENERDADE